MNVLSLLAQADLVVKLILVLLLVGSILSWYLFFYKTSLLKRQINKSELFSEKVKNTADLDEILDESKNLFFNDVFLASIYKAGYLELNELTSKTLDTSSLENINRAMEAEKESYMFKLQKNVALLATISSASPFIGLFGTVWGIMNSFIGLASSTSSSTLNAVAPGIAEALITTAFGLFTAIPALAFYNHLNNHFEKLDELSNNFTKTFINLIYREFIQSKN